MTTNQMIYKTLTTKVTKEPKYKSVLEDMGFQVFIGDMSEYNYWTIRCVATGRTLVISKDCENRRGLFDPYTIIKHDCKKSGIIKVDFVGYLRKQKYDRYVKESEYAELRHKITHEKCKIGYQLDDIKRAKQKVDDAIKYLNQCRENYDKAIDNLSMYRMRVRELMDK